MFVASLLDVVRDQQHVEATSPDQSGTPLKIEEPRKWLRQAEVDAGQADGTTTVATREIRELKRKNAELEQTVEILNAATSFFVRASAPQRR